MGKKRTAKLLALVGMAGILTCSMRVSAQNEAVTLLVQRYEAYQQEFEGIEKLADVEATGYEIIESQQFPVALESFGQEEVTFVPILHQEYHRLGVLIADSEGNVLYKTNQLEANYKYMEQLEQPIKSLAAVSFQDLNHDGLTDIILIANCENTTGDYAGKTYKVGDVLFQRDGSFYRDWRVSDKINRFSMNKSAEFIASHVRDGNSTEALYTATTLEELLENGFRIVEEQNYARDFEKQGRLLVVPGVISMAEYDIFMIYLMNEQGNIVWSFQPMKDYDNLYALKGMTCRDMDGDGMKDIVVLARYSYSGPEGELLIDTRCDIYYQRTDGFEEDTEFSKIYQCTEEDTLGELVEIIREYWGWPKENDQDTDSR
ncbi:VCBS repeat-containing protein [uncultured Acetatifactor sp.]|uniref:VCBS repeat-containing protein n=1 Tax=uncultured Acetatifactor sp. TaxID=1671927 RepID=UPI0026025F17|nr:VCBS repeat-containing protein [uncultured Acetatifactor sp.]